MLKLISQLFSTKWNLLIVQDLLSIISASSLSNLLDNLVARICRIKWKDWDCFLEYKSLKDNLIKCKYPSKCNKDYSGKINIELKSWFKITFKFSNNNINQFILLFRKGVYLYKYMNAWEKFNETSLPANLFFITT